MESGIEYSYLWDARDQGLHRIDTFQVGRVMQRSQIGALDHLVDYLFRDQYTAGKLLTTMHYAVTYRINLFVLFDATVCCVGQYAQDKLDTLLMARDLFFQDHLLTLFVCQFQESARETDLLDATLCHDIARGHIKQFVLNRATTAI